jgi:hypothetical protein
MSDGLEKFLIVSGAILTVTGIVGFIFLVANVALLLK